jgi:hypothetical protein
MTPELFFAHKEGIKQNMEQNLLFAKATNKVAPNYCYKNEFRSFKVMKGDSLQDIHSALTEVQNALHEARVGSMVGKCGKPRIIIEEITERPHCTTYFKGTDYQVVVPVLRPYIDLKQVEYEMKEYVISLLRNPKDPSWYIFNLKCEVLKLFKDGKITWDDVVSAHKEDCDV